MRTSLVLALLALLSACGAATGPQATWETHTTLPDDEGLAVEDPDGEVGGGEASCGGGEASCGDAGD